MASLTKLMALAARPSYWPALMRGIAPTIEHCTPLESFNFQTVIDVGANKGQFAYFAFCQWPRASLHCFEPLPGPRARLAALLPKQTHVHDCALGNSETVTPMHLASREDSSSLLPLARSQKDIFKMDEIGTVDVPVRRLDQLVGPHLARPALLKIDVQGFEYEVLEGATGLLSQLDAIYVEASFMELYASQRLADDVVTFLQDHGFTLAGRFNDAHDETGNLIQADLLFVPDTGGQN